MDDDAAMEEVMLFGRDNGHYPTFDLFKFYYVIVDNYTKEIQYISDEIYVTDKYTLTVEDRNNDGISELYIDYFKDGKFTVDERGYNLRTTRCYDRIEWSPESEKFNPQRPWENDDDGRARWQSLLARCLRGHEADLREQWNV